MTTIKGSCPACGEVELTPKDIALYVCGNAPRSYYSFVCPNCRDEVRKPATDHIVSLLISTGIRPRAWQLPLEALESKNGPALTYDDLLDFVLALRTVDALTAEAIAPGAS